MTEVERMLNDYDTAMTGDAWYSDAVWTVLPTVSPECAAFRPAPDVHSTWELVMHMMYWENVARERMSKPVTPSEELNFPRMPEPSGENWRQALDRFRESNRLFREALGRLRGEQFDEVTPGGKRTFYGDAQGVIQHHIYHVGQIALLRKLHQRRVQAGL